VVSHQALTLRRPVAAILFAARRGHLNHAEYLPLELGRISPTLISVGEHSPTFTTEEIISSVVTASGSRPPSLSSAIFVEQVTLTPSSAIVLASLLAFSRLSGPPISRTLAPV